MPLAEDIAGVLDVLVAKAKALRDAGVTSVVVNNVSFMLTPSDEPGPVVRMGPAPDEVPIPMDTSDPFSDGATYGRPGGKVPGFTRRVRSEDEI